MISKVRRQPTEWEKMFANYIPKVLYSNYIKIHTIATIPIKKIGRGTKYSFFQRRHTNGQWACEKVLKIINHQRNTSQNTRDITTHILEWLSSRRQELTSTVKDMEKLELLYTTDGNVNWYSY